MKPILNLASVGLLLVVPACDALAPKPVGSVAGRVIIDGEGAGGVTVSLSSGATTATGPDGGYRFADVEGGTYSVSISGYPSDATFSTGSVSVEIVSDGQTVIADFRGQYIRTANLTGRVAVDGQSVAGITVTLAGMEEDLTATNGVGQFAFSNLRAGAYTVAISDYDDAEFLATTQTVSIGVGQTRVLSFEGTYPRTARVSGRVAVEHEALEGVVVTLDGFGEQLIRETDAGGRYSFTMLRAGNYTIEISSFDSTDVAFSNTSGTVSVGVGEPKVWDFEGTYVRESTIMGRVTVDATGLEGVTVRLQGMGADESQVTDENGQFIFSNLRAGEYQLAISGYDTEKYGFPTTSATIRVEHGRTAAVPFEGIMLRTASIMGQVSVEGEGLPGVTVSLSGEGENQTTFTDGNGQYAFTELPAGNFSVGISGYDTDEYSFETTSKNVAVALDATATVPFEGILLRRSGVAGRVSVEGTGLDSVTVTLTDSDDTETTTMTDATGQYAFAGLAGGDYTVAISGYDTDAYRFDMTPVKVTIGEDDTQIVNFLGAKLGSAALLRVTLLGTDHQLDGVLRGGVRHRAGWGDIVAACLAVGLDPNARDDSDGNPLHRGAGCRGDGCAIDGGVPTGSG